MSKKNKTYWRDRHEQWLTTQDKDDARLFERLKKDYQRTVNELEKSIASYFKRYGHDNVIEFRTMLQQLDLGDRDLLFRDMDRFAELYPEYVELMPIRESIYRLNRLEGLHYSTQLKLLELGAIEQKELEKHLEKTYGKHYQYMLKELGIGHQFLSIDDLVMRNTIFEDWVNGENFSDRIWLNKEKMLEHLQTVYRDSLARGDNYSTMTKAIHDRFDVGLSDARRLVWTESSFVLNQAHTQAYKQAGVEEYEISAVRDSRTSPICNEMDGKRFKFEEMIVGINFPPFHPYCRTTFIGVWVDETRLLPNFESAVIPEAKLTKYALDPNNADPNKAIAFEKALGYNKDNYQELIKNVKNNLSNFEAIPKGSNKWGQLYQVVMALTGPNGKEANVLTAWIKDRESGETRLTSIYVTNKGVEK